MTRATPGRVEEKVVLVSGAASGMGASHARHLAAEGAQIVLGDLQDEAGHQLTEEINTATGREAAAYVHLDVTHFADWEAAVATAVQRFGGLHALVNNAGIGSRGSAADSTLEQWDQVIAVNLTGPFYGMKAAFPQLSRNETSSIVNVSSIAGLFGFKERVAYSASKWGVQGLTKTSAMDFGPEGIRVNSIHPGSVTTPLTASLKRGFEQVPLGRAAETDEISPLIVYLVSDESRYVSGSAIAIDGGETAGNNLRPMN